LNRASGRSGALILPEPLSFRLLYMPTSLGCVEAVDERPGEDVGDLFRPRAYLLVAQQAQDQDPQHGPGHEPHRQRRVGVPRLPLLHPRVEALLGGSHGRRHHLPEV